MGLDGSAILLVFKPQRALFFCDVVVVCLCLQKMERDDNPQDSVLLKAVLDVFVDLGHQTHEKVQEKPPAGQALKEPTFPIDVYVERDWSGGVGDGPPVVHSNRVYVQWQHH